MICNLCPRRCNAEREETENKNGYCKMPLQPTIARADLHFWEEPPISGSRGSGTVFFSGCNLGCIYCQNQEISHGLKGETITVSRLSEIFKMLEEKGAHNINLVTPTHYALAIIEALKIYKPKIPVVWNTSGYETSETLEMLRGYVDIFLIDFKYLSEKRAGELSFAKDYPQVVKKALLKCSELVGKCIFDEGGIMQKGVIVRHLLLPQATNEAIEIFTWVRENLPNAHFSIMSQYVPEFKAHSHPIINRKITNREYEKVVSYICGQNFDNCYIQERSSADSIYIPPFDFKN